MVLNKKIFRNAVILTLFLSAALFPQLKKEINSPPTLVQPQNEAKYQPSVNLQLKWDYVSGSSIFRVQYALDPSFADSSIAGEYVVSGVSLTIYGLKKDTYYYWRVCLNSESVWSKVWRFKTTGSPVAPRLISPANKLINRDIPLQFAWSADSTNTNYLLQIADNIYFDNPINIAAKDTAVTVNNLLYNKSYYWHVQSQNVNFENSEWSDTLQFKTRLAPPLPVYPAHQSTNIDSSAVFRWNSVGSASAYRIEVATDSVFSTNSLVFRADTNALSLKVDNLSYLTNYCWHVLAYNKAGEISLWSDTVKFRTKLSPPLSLAPADSLIEADTSLAFSWIPVAGAVKYRLQIAEDSLFTKISFDTLSSYATVKTDRLYYSKYYYWHVSAQNKNHDTSNWSAASFFATQLPKPLLISPRNDSASAPVNINLVWQKADSAAFFRLQLSFDSLFSQPVTNTLTKKNTLTAKALINDTIYYWRVKALRSDTLSGGKWSEVYKFKTEPSVIIFPQNIVDTINLSDNYTDTLTSVLVTNYGVNSFTIDKVLVYPDTLFNSSKNGAMVEPGSESVFTIKFNTAKIKNGLTQGKIYFIRKNISLPDDTLSVNISLFIKKAFAAYTLDNITFGNAYANNTYIKNFNISNKDGNSELKIKSLLINGTDTASFKLLDTLNTIAAGEDKNIRISFVPKRTGKHLAVLTISSNSFESKLDEFILTGYGYGGEIDEQSLSSINSLPIFPFDMFANNNKLIKIKNKGNALINLDITFKKNSFCIDNESHKTFILYPEDSISAAVTFVPQNFAANNTDTMVVVSNGFNEDTIMVKLNGGVDTAQIKSTVINSLKLNGINVNAASKLFQQNTPVIFSLPQSLFSGLPGTGFRIKYYTGGSAIFKTVNNDGNYNYIIPASDVNERGFVYSGELYITSKNGGVNDSLTILAPADGQVLLSSYKTIPILVPRSKPADNADEADTKWVFFGFPFDNTVADSVFGYFGGRKNMNDGEWIVYQYNPEGLGSFSQLNDYYFGLNKGYFIAQALKDSFYVSNTYYENIRTRKLTDTVITFNNSGWKTVSNPFTFDLSINNEMPLRKYDTYKKTYTMTYVMKPGEAYFVEPSVNYLSMNTFGSLTSISFPKLLSQIGWHIALTACSSDGSKEVLLSVDNSAAKANKINSIKLDYETAPKLQSNFDFYAAKENTADNSCVSVYQSAKGGVWDLYIKSRSKSEKINLSVIQSGSLPQDFKVSILKNSRLLANAGSSASFELAKNSEIKFKVIIGTNDFTNEKIAELSSQKEIGFNLKQNYPNPFNPSTTIEYSVPSNENEPLQKVELKIFDVLGKEVAVLVNSYQPAGKYKAEFNGSGFASGVYYYRLKAGGNITSNKMILIK